MRNFFALLAAAALFTGNAFAADTNPASRSLAPGKPAGLRQAQDDSSDTVLYIVGLGAIAAGIALVVSDNGNDHNGSSAPTTTTQ